MTESSATTDSQFLAAVKLKKGAERRLLHGHLWVFSNEIDVEATPLRNFDAGQIVTVESNNGKVLGCGYINPATLISVRLLAGPHSGNFGVEVEDLLRTRIQQALTLRQQRYDAPWYRWLHAEGDLLPLSLIHI